MDYELLMNGNIKLGQKAPDFTADSTFGKINLSDYSGKWLVFFRILVISPLYVLQK